MKRFHRPFLLVGLVALSLFVMVLQMSLVDADDDGGPDLPAIAICTTPITHQSSSTRKDERPQNSHNTVALASDAIQFRHLGTDKSDPVFQDGRSILQSFCSLRC
jgi:hypothetical protein